MEQFESLVSYNRCKTTKDVIETSQMFESLVTFTMSLDEINNEIAEIRNNKKK